MWKCDIINFNWCDIQISSIDPKMKFIVDVIWDKSAIDMEGVRFVCWMNERYGCIIQFYFFI